VNLYIKRGVYDVYSVFGHRWVHGDNGESGPI